MKKLFLLLTILFVSLISFSQCENDTINPYFVNFQPEPTVNCDSDLSVLVPNVLDECDDSLDIFFYEEVIATYCTNSYDLFRVYRAFDDNGNQCVESQIIHIVDEVGPNITPLETHYLTCLDSVVFDIPEVTDNCSIFNISYQDIIEEVDSCSTNYVRFWTAEDECGNISNMTQTIIVSDNVPPTITGPIHLDVNEGDNIDTLFVTVADDCHSFTVTYTDTEVSGNNIIRNYTATDYCGNESTFEQIISLISDDDDDDDDNGNNNRVAICHREGNGSYHTIYVAPQAVPAHLAHGDYLGPCTEMIMDWNQIIPNSDLEMRVIKGVDNKYKKFVRVK
jgi:hypothetical protein